MPIIKKVLKSITRRAKLKRKKAIRPRGKFKAHGANAFKTYCRRRTDAEVLAYANQCRMKWFNSWLGTPLSDREKTIIAEALSYTREKEVVRGRY